jgi:hypothetical protein
LAGHPYGLLRRRIARQRVTGATAVVKRRPKARRALEIAIMFEPTRLSGEYLVDAYSQTVPMRPRSVRSASGSAERTEAVRGQRVTRRQRQ